MMRKNPLILTTTMVLFALMVALGCDGAKEERDCVVMLGDSIFDYTDEETKFLEDLAGATYRHYYISGAEMEGGLVTPVPMQYKMAARSGPVRTVILDGGGNDAMISGLAQCSVPYGMPLSGACLAVIDRVTAATEEMLLDMAADGVQNIVWQGYYYTTNSLMWQVGDYTNELMKEGLAEFQAAFPHMKVVFVDLHPHFDKFSASYYTMLDGIHPNTNSAKKMAGLVWEAMKANGIEQGEPCN